MASIKGWQIKGIKTWQGRDWEGMQGNIYLDGKKIGWYNDNGDGGEIDIDVPSQYRERLKRDVEDYFNENPLPDCFAHLIPDEEIFFGALLLQILNEQSYKKMVKRGCPNVLIFREKKQSPIETIIGFGTMDALEKCIKDKGIKQYEIYTKITDFNK